MPGDYGRLPRGRVTGLPAATGECYDMTVRRWRSGLLPGSGEGKAYTRAHKAAPRTAQDRLRHKHAREIPTPRPESVQTPCARQEARGLFLPLRSAGTSGASQGPDINIRSLLGAQTR